MAKTRLELDLAMLETKMGIGVKRILVANEKRTRPPQKAPRLSLFSLSFTVVPSRILDAKKMPWYAKSIDFSMLTRLLSKTRTGSVTSISAETNAIRFKALHNINVNIWPPRKPKKAG
jgi:hypothetical protein